MLVSYLGFLFDTELFCLRWLGFDLLFYCGMFGVVLVMCNLV